MRAGVAAAALGVQSRALGCVLDIIAGGGAGEPCVSCHVMVHNSVYGHGGGRSDDLGNLCSRLGSATLHVGLLTMRRYSARIVN
jgi:hypothetical protein